MGKIFYIMGKSASGKDTVFEELLEQEDLHLKRLVPYTTRPIRSRETEGVEYHFVDQKHLEELKSSGKVIELREYHTMHGIWTYFTVDDEKLNLKEQNYLAIGVPASFKKMREYYGEDVVIPIYIEVDDGIRLERALKRERKQQQPKYEEMCRRFLADQQDFSEENLSRAGIGRRFSNDSDRQGCLSEVAAFIRPFLSGGQEESGTVGV